MGQVQLKQRHVDARYDTRGATEPPNGLARLKPEQRLRSRVGAVVDPIPDPIGTPKERARGRVAVRINVTTDIIELEHAHGRITSRAYKCGRFLMALFERAHGLKRDASNLEPKDSVNLAYGVEAQIERAIDTAADVVWWSDKIQKSIGRVGLNLVRDVIDSGKTYAEISAARGRGTSERAVAYTADRFRTLLEDLAEDLSKERRR